VEFVLTDKELGFYTGEGEFIVEPGEFNVMVGGSSDAGLKGMFIRK
jgi:beta-glucosidase